MDTSKQKAGDKKKQYLFDKRDELCWALADQGYQPYQIAIIFNITHLSTVTRLLARKPDGWRTKWVKMQG